MPQLFFKGHFQQAIREGRKQTTIRRWNKPRMAAGDQAFCPGLGWLVIQSVECVQLDQLTDDHALADGFESHATLLDALSALYPDAASDGKQWFLVRFTMRDPQPVRVKEPGLFT